MPWHRVVSILFFRFITPTGVFPGTILCGFRKKECLNVPKNSLQNMNISNITNKQTNLKDFANWKGGAGKDPNAPGNSAKPVRVGGTSQPSLRSSRFTFFLLPATYQLRAVSVSVLLGGRSRPKLASGKSAK